MRKLKEMKEKVGKVGTLGSRPSPNRLHKWRNDIFLWSENSDFHHFLHLSRYHISAIGPVVPCDSEAHFEFP